MLFLMDLKKLTLSLFTRKMTLYKKTKYKPISMLPISLKAAFERCLRDQIYGYIDNILSKAQCGLKKVSMHSIH